MSTTLIVTIFFIAIAGLIYFLNRKDSDEIKSKIKLMKAENEAEPDDEFDAAEFQVVTKVKLLCLRGSHIADKIRYAIYNNEKVDIEKINELRSTYRNICDDSSKLLADVKDDILFGLCSQHIIGMLIRSGDFEGAKDMFKNIKHGLPIDAISDKYKFLIDEISIDKKYDEELNGVLLK
jgi:hypothetical protein